jgi:branched-chain amino acid transport system permease protein
MIGDIVNGIGLGAILFVLASGFSLALGVMRVVNIAHGAFYMLAVYLTISIAHHGGFVVGVVGSALAVMLLAGAIELGILRWLRQDPLRQVLATFGVTVVIAESTRLIWGGYPEQTQTPAILDHNITIGSFYISWYRIFLMGFACVLAVILYLLVERTKIGARVRAAVDDPEIARSVGINIEVLFFVVFAFAGLLAGLAGGLGGPILGTYQGVQFDVLTLTLVVVVLGGMGSLAGAFVGSIFVGVLYSVGLGLFPQYSYFVLFAPMIILLAVRPTGLLGRKVAVGL